MPIAHDFEFVRPHSLGDALAVLSRHGRGASIIAGGTDLVVWLKEDKIRPNCVVDLKAIPDLRVIELKADRLWIGALATFTEIMENPDVIRDFPIIKEAAETVASVGVRNRATLVGNICSAVPSLDTGPALLVLDAQVHLMSVEGERTVSIHDWFLAPRKTALRDNELVTAVSVPLPTGKMGSAYVKLGRYAGEDIAQAGIAILALADKQYRVAHCALGPIPRRCSQVELMLNGKELSPSIVAQAKECMLTEISPITDIRASREYRIHMTQVMLERGLEIAVAGRDGKKHCRCQILGG